MKPLISRLNGFWIHLIHRWLGFHEGLDVSNIAPASRYYISTPVGRFDGLDCDKNISGLGFMYFVFMLSF